MLTAPRKTLATFSSSSILKSSQRFLSTPPTETAPATPAVENNGPKIPKYYDKLRHEGIKELSPHRAKELAEYGRKKSIEAKSKSRLRCSPTFLSSLDISLSLYFSLLLSIANHLHGLLHR
jgi:hypothetical protein